MRNIFALCVVALFSVATAAAQSAPTAPSFGPPPVGAVVDAFAVPGVLDTSILQATSTISNPTTVTFTASPEHNTVDLGVVVLTNYVLELTKDGATTPCTGCTVNMSKPTPVANQITFTWPDSLRTTAGAGIFTGRVRAVGPAGSAVSAPAPPFDFSPRAPTAPGTPILK